MSSRRRIEVNRRFVRDASGIFTPKSISGLQLWLRADLGITIGTGVSAWADQSGTGDTNKNEIQAAAGAQPIYSASDASYNNKPTLQFDGAREMNPAGAWSVAPAPPLSIYVIGNAGLSTAILSNPGASVAPWNLLYAVAGSGYATFFSDVGSLFTASRSLTSPRCVLSEFTSTTTKIFVDDTVTPLANSTQYWGTAAATGISVGHGTAGIGNLVGTIAEVVVYNKVLSTAERKSLAGYFSRYGLTVTA